MSKLSEIHLHPAKITLRAGGDGLYRGKCRTCSIDDALLLQVIDGNYLVGCESGCSVSLLNHWFLKIDEEYLINKNSNRDFNIQQVEIFIDTHYSELKLGNNDERRNKMTKALKRLVSSCC